MKIPKKKFFTFLSIGVFNTLLDIVVFTLLIGIFGRNPLHIIILNIISFSLVVVIAFFLNGKITFKDNNLSKKKFVKYYGTTSFGMILNTLIVTFFMTTIGSGTVISKIIAACTIVIYNYKMSKNFVFEKNYEK